jgi:hypothetical protein
MPEIEQLAVRNMMPGPTVLGLDINGRLSVEWMGANDPDGKDVQYVPDEVAKSVQFRRACERGILQVEDDPSSSIEKQNVAWERRTTQSDEEAQAIISQLPKNDYVGLECVGPGGREGATVDCGAPVPLRVSQIATVPPLCERHIQLSSRYDPEKVVEERQNNDGETIQVTTTRWHLAR